MKEPLLDNDDLVQSPSELKLTELSSDKEFQHLICSITQDIMKDPYITPYGQSYEKNAILEWLKKRKTDPMTQRPLQAHQIVPNYALKCVIEKLLKERKLDHLLKREQKAASIPVAPPPEIPSPIFLEAPH